MRVVIIIPTYNEALNIPSLLDEILALDPSFEVVVVDDNSPDGTGEWVEHRAAQEPRVHALRRAGKLGYASAVADGLARGLLLGADFLVHMDADFSHQPQYLPALVGAVTSGAADVAIGSRYCPGGGTHNWGLARVLLSRGANALTRGLLGLRVHDCTSGFRCYGAAALQRLDFARTEVDGYSFLVEMTCRAQEQGLRLLETPIIFADRTRGQSKISRRIIFEAAGLVFRRAWRRVVGARR